MRKLLKIVFCFLFMARRSKVKSRSASMKFKQGMTAKVLVKRNLRGNYPL